MGGFGSGRWGWSKSDAKPLVEEARCLDIGPLVRDGVIRADLWKWGSRQWTRNGEKVAAIDYQMKAGTDGTGTLRLIYSLTRQGNEKIAVNYEVPLETTRLPSGGLRWWFRCVGPRQEGPPCHRRVAKLYLASGGHLFACRHCHGLAYTSSRESRKWDRMYAMLAASTGFSVQRVKNALNRDRR